MKRNEIKMPFGAITKICERTMAGRIMVRRALRGETTSIKRNMILYDEIREIALELGGKEIIEITRQGE